MARGITGPFETWKEGIPYECLRGDIEKVAGLTVYEPTGWCNSPDGDPSIRMPFPALRSRHQRARRIESVFGER
jgi:hypothetical protein